MRNKMERGEVYQANLSPVMGSEQGGVRPVLVVQNNVGNYYSTTVIVAAITSSNQKSKLPTHVYISEDFRNMKSGSLVLLEQLRTIDQKRLKKYIGHLDQNTMLEVDEALAISVGLRNSC